MKRNWEGSSARARNTVYMLRMLTMLAANVAITHAHAVVTKPAMRMNPGWPLSKTGEPVGKGPWPTLPYYPFACGHTGGSNCGDALCWKHDTIHDCRPSNVGVPPDPCFGDLPGTRVVTKGPGAAISPDYHPADFYDPFGNASAALNPETNQPWIDNGLNATEWCAGDEITTHTTIQRDHNGIWRWEYQQVDGGHVTEAGFTNATAWRWFSNDPHTMYYKADGKSPIAYDACFDYDTGASKGRGSWAANISQCKTPARWSPNSQISWGAGGGGNVPETFAAATWTLPADLSPGK